MRSLVEFVRSSAELIAVGAEAIGVLVVAIALVRALARYTKDLLRRARPFPAEQIRLGVGRGLALSLEFLLAADIVRTAVAPGWREIGRLAAIAAIRTALNFFLHREIAREESRLGSSEARGAQGG